MPLQSEGLTNQFSPAIAPEPTRLPDASQSSPAGAVGQRANVLHADVPLELKHCGPRIDDEAAGALAR